MSRDSIKILLVDDDEEEYILTSSLVTDFEKENYELSWIETYDEALEVMSQNTHDICLVDYRLGEKNGLELLQEAIPNGCRAPIIMLTEEENSDLDKKAIQAGFADYIVKGSLEPLLLERMIGHALERKRKEAELAQRERYFRALIENSSETITIVDRDGIVYYKSPSVFRALGFQPDELIGKSVFAFIHPDDREQVKNVFKKSLEKPRDIFSTEYRHQDKSEGWHILESVWQNLLDDSVVEGVVINTRDITERNRLEEQLALRQRMDSIGTLAGGIAHDFNNLLTGIMGNLSMLSLGFHSMGEAQRNYLQQAKIGCERSATLIKQFQSLSSGEVTQKESVDVYEIVKEVLYLLENTTDRLIEKRLSITPGKYYVYANSGELNQVLLNLGTNAISAIDSKGTNTGDYIAVEAENYYNSSDDRAEFPPGPYVHITIEDSGAGISEEIKKKIFDPFFTTKKKGEKRGLGLGLAMVYNIVTRNHMGYIDMESQLGKGTTFHIYLPATNSIEEKICPEQKSIAEITSAKVETILVIDDEELIRDLATAMLDRLGYKILTAEDGEEGLQAYQERIHEIDLVILDLTMPKMSGQMVFEKLREIDPQVKVVISSGHSHDNIRKGVFVYAKGFITKPYTLEKLGTNVRSILDAS